MIVSVFYCGCNWLGHLSGIASAREFIASAREFSEYRKFVLLLCVHQAFGYEILSFKNSMKSIDWNVLINQNSNESNHLLEIDNPSFITLDRGGLKCLIRMKIAQPTWEE